ncbi:MAG: cupredoxin domain-containing protein [Ignavibacteria bacterium]|nr:cupredoxin domain-containing protein [Ignavibacteria bacterium]
MYTTGKKSKILNLIFPLFILLLIISISSCNKDETPTGNNGNPGPNEVFMRNDSFSPASRTVSAGTTIKWINKENDTHDVTSGTPSSPSGLFSSPDLNVNGEFTFTFTQAGTFPYFCSHHIGMTGTIIVQ